LQIPILAILPELPKSVIHISGEEHIYSFYGRNLYHEL